MRIASTNKLALSLILLFVASARAAFATASDSLDEARSALRNGHADDALRSIDATLQTDSANAAAWNLQCRVYLSQASWNDAIKSCQRAVQLAPDSSEFHLWLGRAYGEKASRTKMVSAIQTAKLAHAEFETAVMLDGQNREALSDLGEYYARAPHFLGGGFDKAEDLVNRLNSLDPARADELRAVMAEAKKDYPTAEQNWRDRIAASQSSPETAAQAWMDLGSFYRRRARRDEMLAALKSGAAADTSHGPALVDGASTLIAARLEPELAAQWLREYLSGDALSETAPAFAVHAELGDLLKRQGDALAAEREYALARALSAKHATSAGIDAGA